jgi:hypothetical protein
MSDYAISVKVLNGRIRRKIAECGFKNPHELCRKAGLDPSQISALLNLKLSPLMRTGTWRSSAVALAEALGCPCEELFSETQRTLAIRDNSGERFFTEAAFRRLAGRVERPLLDNPEECLLDEVEQQARVTVVRRAMNALKLTPRSRRILEGHFGIGSEETTLNELALELGVSRQGAKRSLSRTLQRLRKDATASHRALLQAYQPARAMGLADEAQIRREAKRAALETKAGGARPPTPPQSAPAGGQTLRPAAIVTGGRRKPDVYREIPVTDLGLLPNQIAV